MPAIGVITVADATPTNHSFNPQTASLALSSWAEATATTYEGNGRVAVSMSNPTSTRKTSRVKLTFSLPIERLVDGVTMVTDTIIYSVEAVVPSNCSAAEALKGYTLFKNLVAHTVVQSYCADRVPVY